MSYCVGCGRFILSAEGPSDAKILIVAEAPSRYDLEENKLWSGDFGSLLRAELRRQGIIYKNCRVTNMWLHPKHDKCTLEEGHHIDAVLSEMADRPAVLLLGAEAVRYFTGYGVSEVSGLRVDTLPHREGRLIPDSTGMVFALFNPTIVLHEKLGELRHGIKKFAEALDE